MHRNLISKISEPVYVYDLYQFIWEIVDLVVLVEDMAPCRGDEA